MVTTVKGMLTTVKGMQRLWLQPSKNPMKFTSDYSLSSAQFPGNGKTQLGNTVSTYSEIGVSLNSSLIYSI